jgi:hypothetical protein
MIDNSEPGASAKPTTTRRIWRYFLPIFGLLVIYVGLVMLDRWQQNKHLEEQAAQKARAQERSQAESTVETLGGNKFDILGFYATPGEIRRGESVQICYGVSNAKSVSLDPPVAEVWPSASRCMNISPSKTTTYTLTAEDAQGNKKSLSLEIKVR